MRLLSRSLWAGLSLLALFLFSAFAPPDDSSYLASVEKWRQAYENKLTADDGWLTVSGLFWLREGRNNFGSSSGNDVVLPAPTPAHAGYFDLHAGKTTVHVNSGVPVTMGGKPVETAELRPDSKQDRLVLG